MYHKAKILENKNHYLRSYKKFSDPKNVKPSVLDTHRQLTAELKLNWPVESSREDRSIKQKILARIADFQKNIDQRSIEELKEEKVRSLRDLQGCQELISNKSYKDFKLKEFIVPKTVMKHEKLLNTESQKKIKKRKWGIFDRFMTWYIGDYSKYRIAQNPPTTETKENEKNEKKNENSS